MKLIIATPSPFARKVRVAMLEKRMRFDEIVDVPWNPETTAPAHNPLGKVPVLILDDGLPIYDSRVIIEYLETLGREPALVPADPAGRVGVRQVEALADGICDAVVLTVLEQNRRPGHQSGDWVLRQRRKIERGTKELARLLGDGEYFLGETLTLADIAAGATLGYLRLRAPDFDWRELYPNLEAFSYRMEERESFAKTKPTPQKIAPVK
jgi:glutathione S-transferase